jgi:nicotinamidase/pyrazinamidase
VIEIDRIANPAILLVVDVQNDFCPGGNLAVPEGDRIVATINRLAARFDHLALTQDWHPAGHSSFASSHPGGRPFETVTAPTVPRSCGPTTASRARLARNSAATSISRGRS